MGARDAATRCLAALAATIALLAGPTSLAYAADDGASADGGGSTMVIAVVVPPHDRRAPPVTPPADASGGSDAGGLASTGAQVAAALACLGVGGS
ncbi:hypothetical protein, partial [Microbacterium hominis]|uniref:hypothetical protein n=1 Tax=Microbacterium hominis TaxID=162426 RepID=UPI000AF91701